ncbi:DUF4194 domain-containing protein [Agromyces mediolanus]|uniref:DUF4194 domain-containing protein n=1 Tax=Agromyces mediolanus TaxID=41986 RepID=UPI00203D2589|nr:DUF4194 domain-containing protein [Agromyces mediolanus]MCM3658983.1 DUF4194 domain-containing protein [Agromyces mediolanus]
MSTIDAHDDAESEIAIDTDPDGDWGVDHAFGEARPGGLPDAARRVLAEILTKRFVVRPGQSNDSWWATLIAYRSELLDRLADLYFDLIIDEGERVVFKRRTDGEEAPKRLLKSERPLSRDASFLLIFLRGECAYTDGEDGPVTVTRTELEEFLRAYRHEGNGNAVGFENRVSTAIGLLLELKLLQQDRDADYLFTISPALPALVGIEEIARLDAIYRKGLVSAEGEDPVLPGEEEGGSSQW